MATGGLNFQLDEAVVLPSNGNIFPFDSKISWPAEQRPRAEAANFASESQRVVMNGATPFPTP